MNTKYVIKNINRNRNCSYRSDGGKPPFWLANDYVSNSAGDTHADLNRAKLYNSLDAAKRQADALTKKYKAGGSYFTEYGYRYPDSCGRKDYPTYAPKYAVVEVVMTITEVR